MKRSMTVVSAATIAVLLWFSITGCSSKSSSVIAPSVSNGEVPGRTAMYFDPSDTIFGDESTHGSDVDIASVVWGGSAVAGDIVVFDDDTSWDVAVAIVDDPDNYQHPAVPMLQFLRNDGVMVGDQIEVPFVSAQVTYARLPKIDCTYRGDDNLEVVVAFRTGQDAFTWQSMQTWDVRVIKMVFEYTYSSSGWDLASSGAMTGGGMAVPLLPQTHPDIVYDQKTKDIYLAWTHATTSTVEVRYARHDSAENDQTWHGPYSLEDESEWGPYNGWFVSLDVGVVAGIEQDPERYVGFAYTGIFPQGSGDWWGFRPIVGWWSIESGEDDDSHPPLVRLIVTVVAGYDDQIFNPFTDNDPNKYDAGLIRVDIPCDNATEHGAAVVFVQDTCDEYTGLYDVYGISSLDYSAYTWLSDPGETWDFVQGTWPSIAVDNSDGDTASVTFMASEPYSDWLTYANFWVIDSAGSIAEATEVDLVADGDFSLDINDFMLHNWGTASSLVGETQGNSLYWTAWSDRMGSSEPNAVKGCMGYANP